MGERYREEALIPEVELSLLTLLLHRLVDVGLGDGPLADRVRDAMDGPWRALSAEQVGRVDEFGARLNSARDLETAGATGRVEELSRIMDHLAKAYWKAKESPTDEEAPNRGGEAGAGGGEAGAGGGEAGG